MFHLRPPHARKHKVRISPKTHQAKITHPTFLQWNCRGFKVNLNELSLQNHCPVALRLQGTHFHYLTNICMAKHILQEPLFRG